MLKIGLIAATLIAAPAVHADVTFMGANGRMEETFASKKEPCLAAGVAFQAGDQVVNVEAGTHQVCTSDAHGSRWVDVKVPAVALPTHQVPQVSQ